MISCALAHSSMNIYEKCKGLKKFDNASSFVKNPLVYSVQTITRYLYSSLNGGIVHFSPLKFETDRSRSFEFLGPWDFEYMRNIWSDSKIFNSRSAISSQAGLVMAQTRIFLVVVFIICSIAATSVLVLPVPNI